MPPPQVQVQRQGRALALLLLLLLPAPLVLALLLLQQRVEASLLPVLLLPLRPLQVAVQEAACTARERRVLETAGIGGDQGGPWGEDDGAFCEPP